MRLKFLQEVWLSKRKVRLEIFTANFLWLEPELIEFFSQYGKVADAIVMKDRQTQRGRGFGFVKM